MPARTLATLRRPQLLHVSVQESLKAFILEHRLAAGQPLPGESDLAHQLGVSRGSVREGIRALESLGIVESRRGIGVFVAAFSFAPLLDNLTFGLRNFSPGDALSEITEILQIRRILEVALIADIATHITDTDIAELRRITERMLARAIRGENFATEDQQFHQTLFRGLGNFTLLHLLDVFWLAFFKATPDLALDNPDPLATWRDHDIIVDALASHDAAAARSRLDQHYDGITRLLARRTATGARPALT